MFTHCEVAINKETNRPFDDYRVFTLVRNLFDHLNFDKFLRVRPYFEEGIVMLGWSMLIHFIPLFPLEFSVLQDVFLV